MQEETAIDEIHQEYIDVLESAEEKFSLKLDAAVDGKVYMTRILNGEHVEVSFGYQV